MAKIRGTHSSPGIYSQFTDLSYASKTLGVTTLGLVGETLKGPAFEPMMISNYNEFQQYFGGCSAEKFKDSQYPKYELPYIAKSYLTKSDKLYVCRVLGLSGYNAGPAFIITAQKSDNSGGGKHVIAVLRSRGHYLKYSNSGDKCSSDNNGSKYDTLSFDCASVELSAYTSVNFIIECDSTSAITGTTEGFPVNAMNYGQFTIVAKDKDGNEIGTYPVSLNAGSKDYILDVLGTKPTEGNAALFVEELYDLHLKELIETDKVTEISSEVVSIPELVIKSVTEPVRDFVTIPENELKRSNLGQTFLCNEEGIASGNGYTYHVIENGKITNNTSEMEVGYIYQVTSYVNPLDGIKTYVYVPMFDDEGEQIKIGKIINPGSYGTINVNNRVMSTSEGSYDDDERSSELNGNVNNRTADLISGDVTQSYVNSVKVLSIDSFCCLDDSGNVTTVTTMSDYHEQFRCASTPWFVSEIKGDAKNLQVKKLFRFHTITDGTEANNQVKISIANIRPDDGTFDVYVRDYYDSDAGMSILESYKNVNMVPGSSKYIGLQIGTIDGAYELKSKYVILEIIENDMTRNCVPCGFLGYPVRDYSAYNVIAPSFTYNRFFDDDIKVKNQYFGMSDITGVDVDMLYYKGKEAYNDEYASNGYTHAFHLDSTLSEDVITGIGLTITIDGIPETSGVTWDAVSPNNVTTENRPPIIGSEENMQGTIYEDVKVRKFTAYFYGGFDGWDIYRNSRTNTDEFKANKYKGAIVNGYGQTFSKVENTTQLALPAKSITSDYYAYLAGINQFENNEKYLINLFATPGIDYVNNTLLVNEVIDLLEDKRGDTFYVVTTPDKPWGASDVVDEMYSSSDAVENLEDTSIDTYFASTYYPWVKYFDTENNMYINLPATKDVLRNMADVDNKSYPWYTPAGTQRGKVDCTRMHFFAKLEDEDTLFDGRINPLKTFSREGVLVWGDKTLYAQNTPMEGINVVRLMLYMKKLISESCRSLIFEPNDATLVKQFDSIVRPILTQIKNDRGITDFILDASQTPEQMDAHEMSANVFVKPTPTLRYIELNFVITPQGVSFSDIR